MQRKIIISVLSVFVFYVLAQDLNYPVKKIDGKEYYIYTVELQEGLYSVSKKFGVKQADIIALNPEAEQGLKAGQHLIIPKISVNKKISTKTTYAPSEFTYVVVEKKQTLYSISKNYNIPIDTIVKYNPIVERGLQIGDSLKIPGKLNQKRNVLDCIFGKKQQPTETTEIISSRQDEFIIHLVKPKETLFSISRLYNVEIAEIVRLNPGSEENLKSGTEIRIPNKNFTAKIENKTDQKQAEQVNVISESLKKRHSDQPIRIAYLLPLMLDQGKVESGNERFIEFYAGSLLAINQAKEKGISLEIFTYDTDRSESKLIEIISNNELKNAALIIGPAYTNQVAIIGDFALKNRVNTLIPFTSKIFDIDTNPYLIQFNPGIQQTVKFIAEQLKNRYRNCKIIFAESIDVFNTDDGKIFCELLRKELTDQKQNFITYQISNTEQLDFLNILDKNQKNIIFFNTDKFSNVNIFLSWLGNNATGYETAYFRHTGWSETDYNYLRSISVTPFKLYPSNNDLSKYQKEFEKIFGRQPSTSQPSYDLLGYDLTNYFIDILQNKGKKYITEAKKINNGNGIQSGFSFERNSSISGIVNNQLYISEK